MASKVERSETLVQEEGELSPAGLATLEGVEVMIATGSLESERKLGKFSERSKAWKARWKYLNRARRAG